MAGGTSGWNYVGGRYVSRAEAIAQGITPPPSAKERKKAARQAERANRLAAIGLKPDGSQPGPGEPAPAPPPPSPPGGKVLSFERPTLDEALNRVRQAPAPATEPPPGPPGVDQPPAPAPPLADITPIRPIQRQDEPDGFAALGGKLAGQGAVGMCGWILRRRGWEPNDPDDEDVERLERGMAKAIRQRIGDGEIPLWMELSCTTALLYMSMANGARRIREPEALPPEGDTSQASAPAAPSHPPAPAPAPGPRVPVVNPGARGGSRSSARGRIVTGKPEPIDLGPSVA